ncbi:hypothetical protein ACVCL0_09150 [Rhodanobacter sp. UC4450_H17]
MHVTCPHCHQDFAHRSNDLPSRFAIGAPVWIYHGASRRRGTVVGVTFRPLTVDYLVRTAAGVECVSSSDVSPPAEAQPVAGNVVQLSRAPACT